MYLYRGTGNIMPRLNWPWMVIVSLNHHGDFDKWRNYLGLNLGKGFILGDT